MTTLIIKSPTKKHQLINMKMQQQQQFGLFEWINEAMERMVYINAGFDEVCQQVSEVFVNQLVDTEDRSNNNILLIGDHDTKPKEQEIPKSLTRDKSITSFHKKQFKTSKNNKNLEIKIDFQDIVQSATIDTTEPQTAEEILKPVVPNRAKSNRSMQKSSRPNSRTFNKSTIVKF